MCTEPTTKPRILRDLLGSYCYGQEHDWAREDRPGKRFRLKGVNRANVVTFHRASEDGGWSQHGWQLEVSGYHQSVFGGFLALRIALFAVGQGEVRLRSFVYRGL